MKTKSRLFQLLIIILCISCSKDSPSDPIIQETSGNPNPEQNQTSNSEAKEYNIKFYQDGFNSVEGDKLQTSIFTEDIQFSTFEDINGINSFDKAYVYSKTENSEGVMLFDDQMRPAFFYSIDLQTGEKSNALIEFETIDELTFYTRIYDYDWANRLGTLLYESIIIKDGLDYTNTMTFENENYESNDTGKSDLKLNRGFNAPVLRLDKHLSNQKNLVSIMRSNSSVEDFKFSWDNLRNSEIPKILKKAQIAGGILAFYGLAVTSAPAIIAGGGLILAAAAMDIVISDKLEESINSLNTSVNEYQERAIEVGNALVQSFNDYEQNLEDHWYNSDLASNDLSEVLSDFAETDLLSSIDSLDDLSDSNGVLQIGLSWNTNTDVDLWVFDPNGEKIYWENPQATSGGYLDRDDVDGFGPENVYWSENIPDGVYTVSVHFYSCEYEEICTTTNYQLKVIDGLGYSSSYSGTLNQSNTLIQVASFEVIGNTIQ